MSLRIISGERRGAHLEAPEGMDTRPLRDRVRQSLFNILRPRLRDAVVLDAFAGSGAVALEALSNGARFATLVEPAPAALAAIRRNVAHLRYESRCEVIAAESPAGILAARAAETFTLLFLMPSYHSGLGTTVLAAPQVSARCAPGATAVLEIHRDEPIPAPPGWNQSDERLYGITKLVLFLRR